MIQSGQGLLDPRKPVVEGPGDSVPSLPPSALASDPSPTAFSTPPPRIPSVRAHSASPQLVSIIKGSPCTSSHMQMGTQEKDVSLQTESRQHPRGAQLRGSSIPKRRAAAALGSQ